MAWDPDFTKALGESTVEPKFALRFNNLPDFIGDSLTLTGGYNQLGYPSIDSRGPSFRGTSVIPQTWNVSFGSFTVPLAGDIRSIFPTVRKGSIAELFAEVNGMVERIAVGQLRNIRGFGVKWTLDFVDLLSAMTARASGKVGSDFAGNDPDEFSYFPLVGKEQEITSNWNKSGSNFPTTIAVDDIRPFQDVGHSDYRVAKVVSGSTTFYVRYSSTSTTVLPAGTLNLSFTHTDTSIVYPGTEACINTSSGSKITSVGLLNGVPWRIFAYIMLSRSGSGSPTFNKYDPLHNFGAAFTQNLFDYGDSDNQKYIKSSNETASPYDWSYVFNSPWNNGIRTLIDTSALCGQWPTWRMNNVTWRGCQDPDQAQNIEAYITTKDIIQITNIDIFDPNNKSTFYRSKNIYGLAAPDTTLTNSKSSTIGEAHSLPAESFKERNVQFVYGYDPNTEQTDRLRCSIGDLNRMFVWDTNVWSKISLQVKMKYASLTCGDIIEIQSEYLRTYSSKNPYTTTYRAMVLSVDWSFLSSRCNLQLAIIIKN
jgi:hypothetical protein